MACNLIVRLPAQIRELAIRKSWFEERERLLAEARDIDRIDSKADFERAGSILAAIIRSVSSVDSMRAKLAAPFLQAARTIKDAADAAKAPLEKARDCLRIKLARYAEAERRRRESARLKAYAVREAAEEEYAAAQRCAVEEFRSESVVYNPPLPPEPPKRPAAFLKTASVSVRARLEYAVSDESQLPRELLSPDKARIRAWIDSNRESLRERLKADPSFTPVPGLSLKLSTEVLPR